MSIVGKWQQPAGQAFPGLWFQFNEDGTFQAEFPEMGITSGGTYRVSGAEIEAAAQKAAGGIKVDLGGEVIEVAPEAVELVVETLSAGEAVDILAVGDSTVLVRK